MADDAEKIAMVIDTQAQLAGLRSASAGVSDFVASVANSKSVLEQMGTAAVDANGKVVVSATQARIAMAAANGSVHDFNTIITQFAATAQATAAPTVASFQRIQAAAASAATTGAAPLVSQVDKIPPSSRSAASAVSRLAFTVGSMGGSLQGAAQSAGTLVYGLSELGGPKMTALANPIGAVIILMTTLAIAADKAHDAVIKTGDAFDSHLKNLDLTSAKQQMADLNKQIGDVTMSIQHETYWQQIMYELYHKRPEGGNWIKDLLADVYHLATGTTDAEDSLERLRNQAKATNDELAAKSKEAAAAQREQTRALREYYNTQSNAFKGQSLQLGAQLNNDPVSAATAAITAGALAQQQAITKEYFRTNEQIRNGLGLTSAQVKQRDALLKQLSDEVTLQDKLARQQNEERRAQATSIVQQSGISAQSDLDSGVSKLAAAKLRDARDAQAQRTAGLVASSVIDEAQRQKDLRAVRDYYDEVEKIRRSYQDDIAASRSDIDPDAAEAAARLAIWREYYDNLGKLGVSNYEQQRRRDEALARLDRDVFVASVRHLQASASAAEQYGGTVGAIAKSVGDAIRRGELAVNAYKDFGKGKSEGAAALAAAASGNFVGAALHGAASVAYFAAAGFEAAGAIGGSGGGGSSGGGGGGGSGQGTFTPTDHSNAAGGQTIIIQTVNPNDRSVISATAYYLNKADVLKVPALLPPAQNGYAVGVH